MGRRQANSRTWTRSRSTRTYPSSEVRDQFLAEHLTHGHSDDATAVIVGDRFSVLMDWRYATDHPHPFNPSPQTIAERVGGQVQ